jgi:hypothetical protein
MLRQLTLPVCQIIIEPFDESTPANSIDLVEIPFEETVKCRINLIDVSL